MVRLQARSLSILKGNFTHHKFRGVQGRPGLVSPSRLTAMGVTAVVSFSSVFVEPELRT